MVFLFILSFSRREQPFEINMAACVRTVTLFSSLLKYEDFCLTFIALIICSDITVSARNAKRLVTKIQLLIIVEFDCFPSIRCSLLFIIHHLFQFRSNDYSPELGFLFPFHYRFRSTPSHLEKLTSFIRNNKRFCSFAFFFFISIAVIYAITFSFSITSEHNIPFPFNSFIH